MFVLEESPEEDLSFFQKGWPRTGLGIVCAALTLLALALGYRLALALVSTAWLLTGMSAFVGPIMSIRGYVFVLLILQVRLDYPFGDACIVSPHREQRETVLTRRPCRWL